MGLNQTVTVDFALQTARGEVTPPTVELVLRAGADPQADADPAEHRLAAAGLPDRRVGGQAPVGGLDGADRAGARGSTPTPPPRGGCCRRASGWRAGRPPRAGDVLKSFTPTGLHAGLGRRRGAGRCGCRIAPANENTEFTTEGARHRAQVGHALDGRLGRRHGPRRAAGPGLPAGGRRRQRHPLLGSGDRRGDRLDRGRPSPGRRPRSGASPTATTTTASTSRGWNEGDRLPRQGPVPPRQGRGHRPAARRRTGRSAGLAWNGAMGVLWVATNSMTDSIYELNPNDCTVLSVLSHPQRRAASRAAGSTWTTTATSGWSPRTPTRCSWSTAGCRPSTTSPG